MQDRYRQLAEIFLQRTAEIRGQKLPSADGEELAALKQVMVPEAD
jgi:hypothetical protein